MSVIPPFTPNGYSQLLEQLSDLGYELRPATPGHVQRAKKYDIKTCFLRHDVDLHIADIMAIAGREEDHSDTTRSCWFIRPDACYNIGLPANVYRLEALRDEHHHLGLHYDVDRIASTKQPSATIARMETAMRWMIDPGGDSTFFTAIAPHRVTNAQRVDPLRNSAKQSLPSDGSVAYISDSTRRWRQDVPYRIDHVLSGLQSPRLLQLNLHPEWWMNPIITGREAHLSNHTAPLTVRDCRAAVADESRAWKSHPGIEIEA